MVEVAAARQRILVAMKPGKRALPLTASRALELAHAADSEILLLSVVLDSSLYSGLRGGEVLEPVTQSRLIEDTRLELEAVADLLRARGAAVSVRAVWGAKPHREIARVAREWQADLVAVGAHEKRSVLHTSLTDTHWFLMRTCSCPLLLVKDSTQESYRTILAAIDPSRAASAALNRDVLKAARRFAAALDCDVRAVHAFPDPARFAIVSAVDVSPGVFYGTENVADLHGRAVEQLVGDYDIEPARTDIRAGEPAAVITQLMSEHDVRLVVLGLSRHSLLQQVALGSITQSVTADSLCDVLLIPHRAERVTHGVRSMTNAERPVRGGRERASAQ